MAVSALKYRASVFINCPLDRRYLPLLRAATFAVFDCGYIARSALELTDTGVARLSKIIGIIRECRFGLHDLSRTSLNAAGLPRFNMPLELGLFLGASEFGNLQQRSKSCLVLDRDRYRYQQFVSDIAGQDIAAHGNKPRKVIEAVRNWLSNSQRRTIPGPTYIWNRYQSFTRKLPGYCRKANLTVSELTFVDYSTLVSEWIIERGDYLERLDD